MVHMLIVDQSRDKVLDFWRGLSVLCVILYHSLFFSFPVFKVFASETASSFWQGVLILLDRGLLAIAGWSGPIGVRFFFVISGYIITNLMLREESKTGSVSWINFYFRRVVRILPAYIFYLLWVVIFAMLGWINSVIQIDLPVAFGFLSNTGFGNISWAVAHTWSLSIEEQFYLLWPLVFVLFRRNRVSLLVVCVVTLTSLSASGILAEYGPTDINLSSFACIAIGALYAHKGKFASITKSHGILIVSVFLAVSGGLSVVYEMHRISLGIYNLIQPYMIISIIVCTYNFHWLIKSVIFNLISKIGLISFSLYLWQQIFLGPSNLYTGPSPLLITPLMIVFTAVSYYFIERPITSWGKRQLMLQRSSSAAKNLMLEPPL